MGTHSFREAATAGRWTPVGSGKWFVASTTQHSAGTVIPEHRHAAATITVVLGGGYVECIKGRESRLPSLTAVIKPSAARHSNHIDANGARCLLIEFPDPTAEQLGEARKVFRDPAIISLSRGADVILRMIQGTDSGSAEGLTVELLALTLDDTGDHFVRSSSLRLRKIRDRLHDDVTPCPSLRTLAADIGWHPVYLARAFRRAYGESIGEYVHRLRLTRAARAIAMEKASLSRIAQSHSYYDHSHLTRDFTARTGMTPAAWRRAAQQGPNAKN